MYLRKASATMGETVGLGAGSGAAVGALTALLDENPNIRKVLKNALIGGAGGAAIGAGAHAIKGDPGSQQSEPPRNPKEMNLALAALSGMLPGVGPAIHGGVSQGVGQGVGSSVASILPALGVGATAALKIQGGGTPSKYTAPLAMLASALGSTGAAYAGNLTREKEAKLRPPEIDPQLVKSSKVPLGMLRSFLQGQKPMFHAMSGDNAKGLLKAPRAMTSTEAVERGLVSNVEAGAGFGRGAAPSRSSIVRPTLGDGSATVSVPELVSANARHRMGDLPGNVLDYAPTGQLAQLRLPDAALQSHARSELASYLNTGASKNWGNVSFSEGAPFRSYGEFGVMTTPSRVTGGITKSLWTPKWQSKEIQAAPNWVAGKSGVPETLQLPSAPGKIFYHPAAENAAMVRQLHARHGKHNVIPWNKRTERQLRGMSGELQSHPTLPDTYGNMSYKKMVQQYPEFPDIAAHTKGEVSGWFGKQAANRVTKSAKEAPGIRAARNATNTDPTPAQASSGNYAKGELSWKGITIKIENPKGTERRGYDKHGAVKWRRNMAADYGYVKSTKAVDGDAIDIFLGPDHDSDLIVVIDQYRGKTFDESKFILAVTTQDQGEKLYLKHYPRGWTLGPVSTTTVPQFKAWLKDGDHKKPFKGQMVKAAQAPWRMLKNLPKMVSKLQTNLDGTPVADIRRHIGDSLHASRDPLKDRLPGYVRDMTRAKGDRRSYEGYVNRTSGAHKRIPSRDDAGLYRLQPEPVGYQRDFITKPRAQTYGDNVSPLFQAESAPLRFASRYTAPNMPHPDAPGDLFRGVQLDGITAQNFKPGGRDLAWGGGYYGGQMRHGSPSFKTAEGYTNAPVGYANSPLMMGETKPGLQVINRYSEAPGQLFTRDYGLERVAANPRNPAASNLTPLRPRSRKNHNAPEDLYETVLDPRHNTYKGTHVASERPFSYYGDNDTRVRGYIPSNDSRGQTALGHYMRNNAEVMGANPFDPSYRATGLGETVMPDRLRRLMRDNVGVFDALIARRIDRHLLPKAASWAAIPQRDLRYRGSAYAGNKSREQEKAAVLGFKALTGHLGPIKQIIRQARADGMKGLGGTRFDAALGRNVRTPITRVKPAEALAQSPNTQHLRTGSSQTSRNSFAVGSHDLQVQKGLPRQKIELSPEGTVSYVDGVKGGVNPSPISSLLHETGHGYALDSVGRLARAPGGFSGKATGDMRLLGTHELPGGYYELDKVTNELAANNAALQLLRGAGAKPQALSYFQAARKPSFDTYLNAARNPPYAISDAQRQLLDRVTTLGRPGFTPSYTGLPDLYAPTVKTAL